MTKVQGSAIAAAVASLMLAGCSHGAAASSHMSDSAQSAAVSCAGINSCKGQGSCKGASNACKGQNSCKGQGWVDVASAKACTDQGGTVVPM